MKIFRILYLVTGPRIWKWLLYWWSLVRSISYDIKINSFLTISFMMSLFKNIFYWYAITVVPISSLCPPPPTSPLPTSTSHHLSSCQWVVYISSLASPFPILFIISLCLFCTYEIMLLNPYASPPLSPFPLPADTLQMISVSMIPFLF